MAVLLLRRNKYKLAFTCRLYHHVSVLFNPGAKSQEELEFQYKSNASKILFTAARFWIVEEWSQWWYSFNMNAVWHMNIIQEDCLLYLALFICSKIPSRGQSFLLIKNEIFVNLLRRVPLSTYHIFKIYRLSLPDEAILTFDFSSYFSGWWLFY